ncbi:MAG: hypothetical protein ACTSW1_13180 [Candidatus Hodarchaeales archaeon]
MRIPEAETDAIILENVIERLDEQKLRLQEILNSKGNEKET